MLELVAFFSIHFLHLEHNNPSDLPTRGEPDCTSFGSRDCVHIISCGVEKQAEYIFKRQHPPKPVVTIQVIPKQTQFQPEMGSVHFYTDSQPRTRQANCLNSTIANTAVTCCLSPPKTHHLYFAVYVSVWLEPRAAVPVPTARGREPLSSLGMPKRHKSLWQPVRALLQGQKL